MFDYLGLFGGLRWVGVGVEFCCFGFVLILFVLSGCCLWPYVGFLLLLIVGCGLLCGYFVGLLCVGFWFDDGVGYLSLV